MAGMHGHFFHIKDNPEQILKKIQIQYYLYVN